MAYRFIGTASDDRSGSRVTSGDFDRDGIADYAIGAYGTGNAGVVYLIAGSDLQALDLANGPSADGIIDLSDVADAAGSYVISGEYAGGGFGVRGGLVLADADGDGRDDVLVGAVLSDMESGAAYLIDSQNLADFASNGAFNISELTSDRAAFADSYRFLGQNPGDRAGQSIDVVGDLTGDDVQDIAIGSYWADPNGVVEAGELAILSGAEFAAADGNNDGTIVLGTNIANQADSYLIEGTIDHGKVGVSVAPGGDPDGNGHDAVLVGEPQLDNSQTVPGTGYAIDGADLASLAGADGILSIADVPTGANSHGFEGATDGDQTGFQMLSIGDIDGDGLAETLVGAPNADAGAADTGTIYIVSSKDWPAGGVPLDLGDPASLQNSWVIEGEANNAIGTGIGDIGDITGGSEAELLIRAFDTTDSTAPGASYLLSLDDLLAVAPTGGTVQIGDIVTDRGDWANSYRIVGADPGDRAGTVNAGVADMFGASGKAGLMIGAPGTGSAAGTTYILGEADLLRHGTDGEVDLGEVLLCFARGTRIAVPGGSRAVEALRPGDLVETLDRGPQPVVWTGPMVEAARGRRAPVVIRAGALGPGVPTRDLWLSPQHRVMLSGKVVARMFGCDEVLAPVCTLTAIPGIERVERAEPMRYVHLLLDRHAILSAEGAPAESLLPGAMAMPALPPGLAADPTPARPILTNREARNLAQRLARKAGRQRAARRSDRSVPSGGPGAVFLVAGTDLQALDRGNAAARLHAAVRRGRP